MCHQIGVHSSQNQFRKDLINPHSEETVQHCLSCEPLIRHEGLEKLSCLCCRSKSSLLSSQGSHYSSQPRLHGHLSASSSPICMTGSMQLSQKYKSSADLVSELLRKPVFTRYTTKQKYLMLQKIFHLKNIYLKVLKIFDVIRYRSIKKKSGGPVPESKDLVKPVTMRPRLATVSSDTDGDEVTDGRNSGSGHSLEQSSWEVGPCSEEASTTNPGPRAAASPAQPRMTQADRPLTSTNTNTRPHGLAGDRASVSTNTVSGAEPVTSNSSMLTNKRHSNI